VSVSRREKAHFIGPAIKYATNVRYFVAGSMNQGIRIFSASLHSPRRMRFPPWFQTICHGKSGQLATLFVHGAWSAGTMIVVEYPDGR
jgi:hypothetical protein